MGYVESPFFPSFSKVRHCTMRGVNTKRGIGPYTHNPQLCAYYRIRSNKRATKKIIRCCDWRSFREKKLTNTESGAFLEWRVVNRETHFTVIILLSMLLSLFYRFLISHGVRQIS